MSEGGTLTAVLPESIFDGKSTAVERKLLLDHFWLRAIITLPKVTFMPFTGASTVLVVAQKKKASDDPADFQHIFMAEPEEVGYKRRKGREIQIARVGSR